MTALDIPAPVEFGVPALVGLAIGIPAYTGLWRRWTGADGDRAWGLGALWIGVGTALMTIAQLLPVASQPIVGIPGGALALFGICACFWMPPPLRPRWYRAQYTPLLRRRRR